MDVLLMDPDVAIAARGPLVVTSIAARLTTRMVDGILAATVPHRQRFAGDAISLSLVRPNVALPTDDARARVKLVNAMPDAARTSVVVIDEPGFWAAAMRGVLASMALVSPTAPTGAASVAEALAALGPRLTACGDLAALERDIVRFRDEHLRTEADAILIKAQS